MLIISGVAAIITIITIIIIIIGTGQHRCGRGR
jgi:hypothetical protein